MYETCASLDDVWSESPTGLPDLQLAGQSATTFMQELKRRLVPLHNRAGLKIGKNGQAAIIYRRWQFFHSETILPEARQFHCRRNNFLFPVEHLEALLAQIERDEKLLPQALGKYRASQDKIKIKREAARLKSLR